MVDGVGVCDMSAPKGRFLVAVQPSVTMSKSRKIRQPWHVGRPQDSAGRLNPTLELYYLMPRSLPPPQNVFQHRPPNSRPPHLERARARELHNSILKAPDTRTNAFQHLIHASYVGRTRTCNLLQAMMPNACVAGGQ